MPHSSAIQSRIKRCQLTTMRARKRQQIGIGQLARVFQLGLVNDLWVMQTDIIRPKNVAGQ